MAFVDPDTVPNKAPTASFIDPDSTGGFIDPDEGGAVKPTPARTLLGTLKDIGTTAVKSAVGLPQSLVGMADLAVDSAAESTGIVGTAAKALKVGRVLTGQGRTAGEQAEKLGIKFADSQKILDESFSPAQKAAQARVKDADGFVDTASALVQNPSVILQTVGESAGSMLGGAGVARGVVKLAPKLGAVGAGALGEGAIGAGSTAEDFRIKSGGAPISEKQREAAGASGVGTALFAFVGGKLAQKAGLTDVDTLLATGELQRSTRGFAARLAGGGISEGVFEELPQSMQEQMWNNYGMDRPLGEGVGEAGAYGMLAGMAMGGGVGALTGGGKASATIKENPGLDAKVAAEELDTMMGKITENYPPQQYNPDLTPEQSLEADLQLEQLTKGIDAPAAESGPAMVQTLDELFGNKANTAPDTGGISAEVLARREGEEGVSTVPHSQRIFDSSTDARMDGLTPMQVGFLSPGVVTGLIARNDERNYPIGMRRATTDTVQQWAQKYMPGARVIVNFDSLGGDNSAFGAYQRAVDTSGNIIHVITPREMPSLKYQGGNSQTRMESLTALSHEFGHGLAEESFFEGLRTRVGDEAKNTIQSITKLGVATPEQLSALAEIAPLEVGLVQEWLALKQRVESGEMTAKEWMDTWVSPRKHGAGIAKTITANMDPYEWARARVPQGKTLEGASAKDLIETAFPGGMDYALTFDEYFAEQMSRAAYAKGDLASSPLNAFFQDIIGKLRDFFRLLKKDGVVAPGTKFNDWLDALVAKNAELKKPKGKQKLTRAVLNKRAKLRAESRARLGLDQAEVVQEPEEIVPEIKEVVAPPAELATGLELKVLMNQELDKMVQDGVIEKDDKRLKSIRYRISIGAFEEAREKMRDIQDGLMYDREYTTRAIQRLPNKAQVKLETIKALMNQQSLRKQDKIALEELYENAQIEGLPSIPKDAVVEYIMDRVLPLKFERADLIEFPYNENGWENAGESADRALTWTLNAPVQISRPMALGDKAVADHWKDSPDVVAHIRMNAPRGEPGLVIIGEIQSDLMAKSKGFIEPVEAEYDPEYSIENRAPEFEKLEVLRQKWYERVVQEILGKLAEVGKTTALIPLESAVAAIQGFTPSKLLAALESFSMQDKEVVILDNIGNQLAFEDTPEGTARILAQELYQNTDETIWITGNAVDAEGRWLGTVTQPVYSEEGVVTFAGEDPHALVTAFANHNETANANGYVPKAQATIDFYEQTLQGFLKSEKFKLKKVERNGLDYLEVDLTDKRSSVVVHWDRENPVAPNIPMALVADTAGVQSSNQIEDAIQAFEKEGIESVFFKRWLGQSQLKNAATEEPLRYWYKSGEVTLVGDTAVYALNANWRNPAWGMQDIRNLRDYYVKMENPMRVEYPYGALKPEDMQSLVQQAQTNGHDGIVLKGTGMPFEDTQVLVWNPEQLADNQLNGKPEKTHFDLESPVQAQVHATLSGQIKEFLSPVWMPMVAMAGKAFDQLVQLQQRAVVPLYGTEFDLPLQSMVKAINMAETFKNQLQVQGEQVAKEILSLGVATQNLIEGFLSAEWKAGRHWTALAEDSNGRLVYQPSELFRQQLKEHGIDPQTTEGQELAKLILAYKNAAQTQFEAQKQILMELAINKYDGNPLLIARAHQKIKATFTKLQNAPFMPRGHFGNYVVIVKESAKKDGKGFVPVSIEHFESEASFQKARAHWLKKQDENPRQYKVSTKELKDFEGIPVNLPVSMLANLQETGLFSEDQLAAAAEIMQPDQIDKIAKRFEDATNKLDGASTDFVRNYADFIWHNANFTWKLRYRSNFTRAIQWQQHEIRELHKSQGIPSAERNLIIAKRNRNLKMMENTKSYLLYPTSEFQGVRLWVTLMMLAYNFKTALLNFTTMLNTGAAMTTEYGELKGTRFMLSAMQDLLHYKIDTAGWITEAKDNAEMIRRNAFSSVMNDAIRDGIVDQSYAYFLAGQSTSSAMLRQFRRTTMGHMARQFIETGMWTFRTVEKVNRSLTLMGFFNAEFDRLRAGGMGFELARTTAYENAKSKTLLIQNAYDAGNRSEFLRGKKSVLFIFMSYVQFMGWIMTGGYERGQRAQFRAEGRAVRPLIFGTTVKLWLVFLLLSGLEGLPFGSNLMDILQAIWRKLSGGENLRLEMRKFFQEYGADSNLVMHGLMHNAGGMNLSGSFGLGQIIPGTEMLNRSFDDAGDVVGKGVFEVAGPAGGIAEDIIKVIGLTPKLYNGRVNIAEVAKELPGATGNVGRALDAYHKQTLRPTYGVTTKGGERLTADTETGEFRDLSDYELAMLALGAPNAMLAENRERKFSQTGEIIYWRTRRGGLLETYRKAVAEKDLGKRKASQASIDEYNEQVPNFRMKITTKDRLQTVRDMRKRNQKLEQGKSTEKRYNSLVKDVDEAF